MRLTPRRALLLWVLAGAALLVGLAWVTRTTLALERTEWEALHSAAFEEDVRLALWRMDAALAALVALESARPVDDYVAATLPEADLPAELAELVTARFEISPPAPVELSGGAPAPAWLADLPPLLPAAAPGAGAAAPPPVPAGKRDARQSIAAQQRLNVTEFDRRRQLARQSQVVVPEGGTAPAISPLSPRWIEGELVLARGVRRPGETAVQGTWLDAAGVIEWLLAESRGVLPEPRLVPVVEGRGSDPGRRLALLPLRLEVQPPVWPAPPGGSRVRLTLAAVWAATLLALGGLGVALVGTARLSQRRGDFVSAVTHELRTPLTTVRLYVDLLVDGKVPAAERHEYLETLRRESDRLGHLVENVLSFARLERRAGPAEQSLSLGELLDGAVERIEERARRAGFELALSVPAEHRELRVRAEAESIERILLNLTDNACKYAGQAAERGLTLETRRERDRMVIRLRDFGPGIAARERSRLFRPFHRSARAAAGGPPGVGLGLALSRQLARRMGGDLRLARVSRGAAFDLLLRES